MTNRFYTPVTRRQALTGILPFLAFGIANMIGNVEHSLPIRGHDAEMAVYGLSLVGLLIGWTRDFPLWSYSYLGWSILLAYFNTNAKINGVRWDYQVWIPFGVALLIAVLWTRSITPLKKLCQDVWQDWTRLSLAMFALGAFIFMGGGEDHHPNWFAFMLAAMLVLNAGAWFFLRSSSLKGRILSIGISFVASAVPMGISYLTWDWRAYYGLPPAQSWRGNLGVAPVGVLFWLLILYWPVVIGLARWLIEGRVVNTGPHERFSG